MERIERHDGALCSPCKHCGRKPRYVMTVSGWDNPTTRRLECPEETCGIVTDEHLTIEEAQREWEVLNADP